MFDWSFGLGFPDPLVVRLIASNLLCLELLTGLDVGLMALTSTLKKFRCSTYKMAIVSEFFCCNKLKLMSVCIIKFSSYMWLLANCVVVNWKGLWLSVNALLSILVLKRIERLLPMNEKWGKAWLMIKVWYSLNE